MADLANVMRSERMFIGDDEVVAGDVVGVKGLRGRFEFRAFITTPRGDWVDVYGGTVGHEKRRAFPMERITVRRKGRR